MPTWDLMDSRTMQPGQEYVNPTFIPNNRSAIVRVVGPLSTSRTILAYASVAAGASLVPSGAVLALTNTQAVQGLVGVFLKEDLAPWGLPGWFVRLYVVNRPNAVPVTLQTFRQIS